MSIAVAGPAGPYRITAGLACGMGAGALWGLVFLAPELVRGFTPLQLAIGRYLAFGAIAAMLIAPRWRGLVRKLAARDWVALGWLDRKSTRLNSQSLMRISSAVLCLHKKKQPTHNDD